MEGEMGKRLREGGTDKRLKVFETGGARWRDREENKGRQVAKEREMREKKMKMEQRRRRDGRGERWL